MTTVKEVVNWAKGLADSGKGVDFDGYYGTQCVDLPNWILGKFFGKSIWGNAIDLLNSAKQAGYTVIYDAPGVNPKAGDIFVMRVSSHIYGHTGLVIADSDGYSIKTIEQNVDGNADALTVGGPARYITRSFNGVVGWIRPPYSNTTQTTNATSTAVSGKLKDERGTMTVKVSALNVRDKPSTSGNIVATYKNGESLNYDSVYNADGYIWVSYISTSGKRRYVAAGISKNGLNTAPFGTFK